MPTRLFRAAIAVLAVTVWLTPSSAVVHGQSRVNTIAAVSAADLRSWDAAVNRMVRDGELTLRLERADTLLPGRTTERYIQTYKGVPVYGGDVARQVDDKGMTLSIFGSVYEGIAIGTEPALSAADAQRVVERDSGATLGPGRTPRLMILPRDDQSYTLVYQARIATRSDIVLYFVDAKSGAIVKKRSDVHKQQAAIGLGTGVLGDRKKISASTSGGAFVESDRMRPPVIETFDTKGDLDRVLAFLNGEIDLGPSDLATDTDNDWTDGADVDAHTYAGYTYDYFFKRFGRRGLDNANIRIRSVAHPVRRNDIFIYLDRLARNENDDEAAEIIFTYYLNAFYAGGGVMVYGEGLPPGLRFGGQSVNFFAGALDIVAHELSHGVTDYSSQLIYENESGALNEAFSDMMGTSVEYFFQTPGSGTLHADYLIGEDVFTPGGIRSMSNPASFGDPDHYSRRFTGPEDNGGVHINSAIPNQAFYLAIEGGTNRTSGLRVEGVGGGNREQIEKVFYRAFTQLMPAGSTFATARAATIQAARDLYGANSPAERAVTQAWTAVGVN